MDSLDIHFENSIVPVSGWHSLSQKLNVNGYKCKFQWARRNKNFFAAINFVIKHRTFQRNVCQMHEHLG